MAAADEMFESSPALIESAEEDESDESEAEEEESSEEEEDLTAADDMSESPAFVDVSEAGAEAEAEEESDASAGSADSDESEEFEIAEIEAESQSESDSDSEGEAPTAAGPTSACLKSFQAAKTAAAALTFRASYAANNVRYSQPNRSFGLVPGTKKADCSSFVTSVLESVGYNCLWSNAEARNTQRMNKDIRARGGYKTTAKPGDLVMWSGHTGLISPKSCPKNTYELVAMGLHGAKASGCLTVEKMKKWGSGTWLGFWTPRQ